MVFIYLKFINNLFAYNLVFLFILNYFISQFQRFTKLFSLFQTIFNFFFYVKLFKNYLYYINQFLSYKTKQ